jgi:hypothetical protein
MIDGGWWSDTRNGSEPSVRQRAVAYRVTSNSACSVACELPPTHTE